MCGALVDAGYCQTHAVKREQQRRQQRGPRKYDKRSWRDGTRLEQLAIEPLCRMCRQAGRITAATEVDHIDGDADNDAPSNRQSLCKSCHSTKTALENGSFGRNGRGGGKV